MTDKGYTIKEIADELGVSKQAVHQKRKSKELSTRLQPFTATVDGVVYITVDGVMLLRQAFEGSDRKQVDGSLPSTVDGFVYGSFTVLQGTIEALREELKAKNEQIAGMERQLAAKDEQMKEQLGVKDEQIAALTAALTAAQALHAGTIQKQLTDGKKRRKWRFPWEKENDNG